MIETIVPIEFDLDTNLCGNYLIINKVMAFKDYAPNQYDFLYVDESNNWIKINGELVKDKEMLKPYLVYIVDNLEEALIIVNGQNKYYEEWNTRNLSSSNFYKKYGYR